MSEWGKPVNGVISAGVMGDGKKDGQPNKSKQSKGLEPQVSELFTPQEEAFLRHYSESKLRYEAMVSAGYVAGAPEKEEMQGIMAKAGALVARAEQMSLPQIATAIGADKVLFMARLWAICNEPEAHDAIKGLQLLARIHGVWDKAGAHNTQVALVFNQAQAPTSSQAPADLPFTLASGDYRPYKVDNSENEGANSPDK